MNLLSTGGLSMCSRRETEQLPTSESGKPEFGIEIPESVNQALALDAMHDNILRADAILKC